MIKNAHAFLANLAMPGPARPNNLKRSNITIIFITSHSGQISARLLVSKTFF